MHWLDIVQMAFDEACRARLRAWAGKLWFTDNRETPDTLQVTYEYRGFIATYENRNANGQSMFNKGGGILFHGSAATLYVDREGLSRDTGGERRPAHGREIHFERQCEPLGQLPRVRAHAPGLGRTRIHGGAGAGARLLEPGISGTVEAGGLGFW
ncbi:MAG TPA: hypothetical protein VMR62_14770 [Bryobacteraceae bacterium]|nr:hypothetical protein [Bryobacteraceae bacterium]